MLHGISHAAEKRKMGNIKALEPETFVRTSCLRVRFTARRRLVMAAERDRRFYTGKSSGNKGATLTALKHQADQQEALGFNVCQRGVLGVWVGQHHKKKRTTKCFAPILRLLFVGSHKPGMKICLQGK